MHHPLLQLRLWATLGILLMLYVPVIWIITQLGVPLWMVISGTLVVVWLQYVVGTWMVLRSVDAERLEPDDQIDQRIIALVEDMASDLGVTMPRLYYGEMNGPNAFAVGRKGRGRIVISPVLLQILTPDELQAVLAHELSHLRSNDIAPMIIGESIASGLEIVVSAILAPLSSSRNPINESAGRTVHIIVLLFVRGVSRKREFLADSDAKSVMGSGEPLKNALRQITGAYQQGIVSSPPKRVESLCFAGEWDVTAALATHPDIEDRVARLEK